MCLLVAKESGGYRLLLEAWTDVKERENQQIMNHPRSFRNRLIIFIHVRGILKAGAGAAEPVCLQKHCLFLLDRSSFPIENSLFGAQLIFVSTTAAFSEKMRNNIAKSMVGICFGFLSRTQLVYLPIF
jgi:hypothetical protein